MDVSLPHEGVSRDIMPTAAKKADVSSNPWRFHIYWNWYKFICMQNLCWKHHPAHLSLNAARQIIRNVILVYAVIRIICMQNLCCKHHPCNLSLNAARQIARNVILAYVVNEEKLLWLCQFACFLLFVAQNIYTWSKKSSIKKTIILLRVSASIFSCFSVFAQ